MKKLFHALFGMGSDKTLSMQAPCDLVHQSAYAQRLMMTHLMGHAGLRKLTDIAGFVCNTDYQMPEPGLDRSWIVEASVSPMMAAQAYRGLSRSPKRPIVESLDAVYQMIQELSFPLECTPPICAFIDRQPIGLVKVWMVSGMLSRDIANAAAIVLRKRVLQDRTLKELWRLCGSSTDSLPENAFQQGYASIDDALRIVHRLFLGCTTSSLKNRHNITEPRDFFLVVLAVQRLVARYSTLKLPFHAMVNGLISQIAQNHLNIAVQTFKLYQDLGWIGDFPTMQILRDCELDWRSSGMALGESAVQQAERRDLMVNLYMGSPRLFPDMVREYLSKDLMEEVLRILMTINHVPEFS